VPAYGRILQYIVTEVMNKEQLQAVLRDADLPTAGRSDALAQRVLNLDGLSPKTVVGTLHTTDLQKVVKKFDIPEKKDAGGTSILGFKVGVGLFTSDRERLQERVIGAITKDPMLAPASPAHPAVERVAILSPAPPPPTEPPLTRSEHQVVRAAPVIAPMPTAALDQNQRFQAIASFLEAYIPSRRFRKENMYEVEISASLSQHFGPENIKTQLTTSGGRIDIDAFGVGIEVKVPKSVGELQRLIGQATMYQRAYGTNLIVLLFGDLSKRQDLIEYANMLRASHITVFIK
jgi:hypothetical protein